MTTSTAKLRRRTVKHEHTQQWRSTVRVLRSSNRFWRFTDFPGSSASAAQHLLTDLAVRSELIRVRKGLYWRGVQTPLGMSPPHPDALVRELVGSSAVGPAGLSAANALRLSTQVPRRAHVAVPARAPESTGLVRFVSRPTRTARAKPLVQFSNRLLVPPDGMPLTPESSGGYRGAGPSGSRTLKGLGLDTSEGFVDGFASEWNSVPLMTQTDAPGTVFTKVPPTTFPIDSRGRSIFTRDAQAHCAGAIANRLSPLGKLGA